MIQKLLSGEAIRNFLQKLMQRPDYYAIKHYEKQRRRSGYIRY